MTTEPKKVKKVATASEKRLRKVHLDIDFECLSQVGDLKPSYKPGEGGVLSMGFVESEYGDPVLEVRMQPTKANWRGDSDIEVWVDNYIQIPVGSILYMEYEERGDRSACCGSSMAGR